MSRYYCDCCGSIMVFKGEVSEGLCSTCLAERGVILSQGDLEFCEGVANGIDRYKRGDNVEHNS